MGNCSGKEKVLNYKGIMIFQNAAIDIPVVEEETVESLPDSYKIILLGDRAVGKSR